METDDSHGSQLQTWGILLVLAASILVLPALILVEINTGLLSATGVSRKLLLGTMAITPGFSLSVLSVVVMVRTN